MYIFSEIYVRRKKWPNIVILSKVIRSRFYVTCNFHYYCYYVVNWHHIRRI